MEFPVSRKRFYISYILFFCLNLFPARAETVILTVEEAVERALNQSINLRKSAIDLAQTEYSAKNLWSEIFPGFSLSAGLTFLPGTNLFTDPGFSYKSEALAYSLSFGISMSFNPSLGASMKRIELAYRAQLLTYEDARRQLEIQVVKNFLNMLTRIENISLMEQNLEVARQKLEKDRIARQTGLLSELSWLNSQLSVENARYNLITAQGSYQTALGEFLALLGMNADTDITFRGTIGINPVRYDSEQLIREHLPKRPDIVRQRQTIERLELTKSITALNSRSPTLDLSASWRGGTPSGNRVDGLADPFTDSLSGSVTLRIPIDSWIPGTRQNQTIRASNAELEKALLDLENIETRAKTEIRAIISNLNSTWESLEIARLRVQISTLTVQATELGFQSGTVEFRDLEDTRRELMDVQLRLLQGEYTYQSLLLDLAAALNMDWKLLTAIQAENF